MAAWRLRVDGGGYLPGPPSREEVAYVSGPAVGEHACKTLYLDRRLARNRDPVRMKVRLCSLLVCSVGLANCGHRRPFFCYTLDADKFISRFGAEREISRTRVALQLF